ncbi:unnamed protein product [Dovyalis caffra]|uniref:Uncharacterized protein n=1 Tax=Dovyalis caffra TaxID=77055 RepID=A0AAV1RVM6_9ROSI|nr:unnamed protein product [Dovyalis caffra]
MRSYKRQRTRRYTQNVQQAAPQACMNIQTSLLEYVPLIVAANSRKIKKRFQPEKLLERHLFNDLVRQHFERENFSIQSLQHTPILSRRVPPIRLHIFVTKSW